MSQKNCDFLAMVILPARKNYHGGAELGKTWAVLTRAGPDLIMQICCVPVMDRRPAGVPTSRTVTSGDRHQLNIHITELGSPVLQSTNNDKIS